MFSRVGYYIRRGFVQFRARLVFREYSREIAPTLALTVQLATIVDDTLYDYINHRHQENVYLSLRFRFATQATAWLFYVADKVKKGEYIDDNDLFPGYGIWSPTLDAFLVNAKGGSVPISHYQKTFREGLYRLFDNIAACDDTHNAYYTRRLGHVIRDLFAIQEGMLTASVSNP